MPSHRHACERCGDNFNPDGWTYCPLTVDHEHGLCADCIKALWGDYEPRYSPLPPAGYFSPILYRRWLAEDQAWSQRQREGVFE